MCHDFTRTIQPRESIRNNINMKFIWIPTLVVLSMLIGLSGCSKPADPVSPEPKPEGTSNSQAKPVSSPSKAPQSTDSTELTYINHLSQEQIDEGLINLFDNETLFGWHKQNNVNWSVVDEAITADSGPIGLLLTDLPFADFELTLEFRMEPGCNSGVFIRCADDPKSPVEDCYEINLADEHPEGYLSGSVVGLSKFDPGIKLADNAWHKLSILANGSSIEITIDETHKNRFDETRDQALRSGLIGLQKNSGEVAFRNIQLKPLQMDSLFTGEDLSGWREVPGSQSVIDVVKQEIHVVSGPGFLETIETFDDFVLQFQAKTNAAELNSGLFFRAMTGTEENPSNGYEVQIHNGFKDDDRNQPNNAGTGAIFRRIDARRVVSSDLEWCTITLVASGPHIATWVDGYPVVSWEDTREPDENPRKGKRLNAGHLSLQGHDPTTDLYFKNFRISNLPE